MVFVVNVLLSFFLKGFFLYSFFFCTFEEILVLYKNTKQRNNMIIRRFTPPFCWGQDHD